MILKMWKQKSDFEERNIVLNPSNKKANILCYLNCTFQVTVNSLNKMKGWNKKPTQTFKKSRETQLHLT